MRFTTPTLAAALASMLLASPALAIMTAGQTPCTTTLPRVATLNVGPTSTRYLATTTSTSHVNCSGCNLVVETFGGPGPVAHFTTTVTVPLTTRTAFVCHPSPIPQ